MTKILEEVNAISSEAIAKKQDSAKSKMPEIIKQIKGAAALAKTCCTFPEWQIDEFSKKLLEVEGFRVMITTQLQEDDFRGYYISRNERKKVWEVSW